jgi:hypothetical protein
VAPLRPLFENKGAIKISGSPFRTFSEAEEACDKGQSNDEAGTNQPIRLYAFRRHGRALKEELRRKRKRSNGRIMRFVIGTIAALTGCPLTLTCYLAFRYRRHQCRRRASVEGIFP